MWYNVSTAVLFWGQPTLVPSASPPKRDCGPERVKAVPGILVFNDRAVLGTRTAVGHLFFCVLFRLACWHAFLQIRMYAQLAHTQQQHQEHQRLQYTGARCTQQYYCLSITVSAHVHTDTAWIRHIDCCCRYCMCIYRCILLQTRYSRTFVFLSVTLTEASMKHRSRADLVDARCSNKTLPTMDAARSTATAYLICPRMHVDNQTLHAMPDSSQLGVTV